MKRFRVVILLIISLLNFKSNLFSQIYYTSFSEGFETNGEIPLNWINEYIKDKGNTNWQFQYGGFSTVDTALYPLSRKPMRPHSGRFNAMFELQSMSNEATILVTPEIKGMGDFGIHPVLRFWEAQGTFHGTDELRVYYRTTKTGTWKLLATYTDPTETPDSVYWVKREISLPANDLSNTYYIGFEATTKWGWGVCLDDVSILETGTLQKKLKSVTYNQPLTSAIPIGTKFNQILRLDLKVTGNTGSLKFKSLSVDGLNTDNNDIANNGVNLYLTTDSTFSPSLQLGTPQTINSSVNRATFSGLDYELPFGASYLWITYDIKNSAIANHFVDALIKQNAININDSIFPAADVSPTGQRELYETIFVDDFETDKGWTLSGEFERNTPGGLGGSTGIPDPVGAFNGNFALGTDLTGLGTYHGDYERNIGIKAYQAISPTIDLKYYNNLQLSFYRWLNLDHNDQATIDFSTDNGSHWQELWINNGIVISPNWSQQLFSLPKEIERQSQVKFRFTLGPTDGFWQFSGWNIDDFIITADHITTDVGVTKWIGPNDACSMSANTFVTVRVTNFADGPSKSKTPIGISIDNGASFIVDTLYYTIPKDGYKDFTFTKAVDFSRPDIYNVIVKTMTSGDKGPENDALMKQLYSFPTHTIPYANNFDGSKILWKSEGNKSWEWGSPSAIYLNPFPSPPKVWITKLEESYYDLDTSWVVSPCFDFTNIDKPVIDFKFWNESEKGKDGTVLQYSTDGGTIWQNVPKHGYSQWKWNWYNNNSIAALGGEGWDTTTVNWLRARQFLPTVNVTNNNKVRFRYKFQSDVSNDGNAGYKGFAFDNFRIYNAPYDVGVVSIDNILAQNCQSPTLKNLSVTVKNYGLRDLQVNDTMIVGVKVNNSAEVTDTFKLQTAILVGESKQVTLHKQVPIVSAGSYKVKAFTKIDMEPYYYNTDNDTATLSFTVNPNPTTNLPDTVYSAEPDTLRIKTHQGANYAYSWEYGGSTVSTTDSVNVKNGALVRVGNFHLTVTDNTPGNGCVTKDTTYFKLLKSDIGISKIIEPFNHCEYDINFKPIVRIKNFGTDTLKKNRVVPIQTRITKGGTVGNLFVGSYTMQDKLAPGDSTVITLNNSIDLTVPDLYTFMVRTALSNDLVSSNDSSFNSFQIYGRPSVDLGPDMYKKQLSYTIKAPIGYSSYLWSDNTTNDSLVVTTSGKYKVTVTNTNGCAASDSVNIMLSVHDLAIKRVISPLTFCTKPGMSTISCKLMNNGSDTIKISETIVMSYAINGGTPIVQNYSPGTNILPNDTSTTFTFTTQQDISAPSTYNFLIKATVASDLRRANDSVLNVVKVYSNPSIELGQDQIIHALSYKVAPGNNYASYLWQDNSTDSTYVITQTHKNSVDNTYSVTVTDGNGCAGSDAVHVYFYVDDLKIDSVGIPATACSQPFPVKVKVSNSGSENYINKDLVIRYQVNSDPEVMEAFKFTGNPNDKSIFTFAALVTPNKTGYNKIKATIEMIGDLRRDNDTLTKTYNGMNGPTIDFGATNDILNVDLPYTLDAGSGTNYNYTWSNAATTQTISVSTDGLYTVTVTDGSCTASKSVTVVNNIYDLSVSGFTVAGNYLPLTACKFSKKQAAFIEIENLGNVSLTDQPITVQYQINSGTPVSKSVTFTGAKLDKTLYFIDSLDLSQAAISTFTTSLTYAQDKVSSNNSITKLVNILADPVISFVGAVNDTLKAGSLPITLNPGSGTGYTYAWYDGSTTQTITTSNTIRWHWVTMSNGYCSSKDSVWVKNSVPVLQISGSSAAIIIYPNPVSDMLNVELSVPSGEDVTYEFITTSGAIVKTGKLSSNTNNAQQINMTDMPKGLYYLRLHRKDWSTIEKVVVQ